MQVVLNIDLKNVMSRCFYIGTFCFYCSLKNTFPLHQFSGFLGLCFLILH